jgi:glycosyltransferase involved in cell wall biosynthesis
MIAVVIPSYRVKNQILDVLSAIGPEVSAIYVVDDCCPEKSGDWVEEHCDDSRIKVLRHEKNQGVGGATISGYRAALADGADILVKVDGDGQMDPARIPRLVRPILDGEADYVKGNRFFDLDQLQSMPRVRLFGNAFLSFFSKLSSGYWNVFDPTNGFTALHAAVADALPLQKLSQGWFFESDLLFRLGTLRAVVRDIPMPAVYRAEESSLVIHRVAGEFAIKHVANTIKRIFYSYYLRNFNIASIELVMGSLSLLLGLGFGAIRWLQVASTGVVTTSGTVMLAALPVLIGVQFILAFLSYDLQNVPTEVLHRTLGPMSREQ